MQKTGEKMQRRYERNIGPITREEQAALKEKNVCVVGCGGLGGYVIELLARMGVGRLTLIDADVFAASNLNRQLLCEEGLLGVPKARAAKERVGRVNSEITVKTHEVFLTRDNALQLLSGHDLVIDALDNVEARLALEDACAELGIVLVHGAVAGWNVQICTVYPGDGALRKIYGDGGKPSSPPGVLPFAPAFAASLETAQAVKVLLDKPGILRNRMFVGDLLSHEFYTFDL